MKTPVPLIVLPPLTFQETRSSGVPVTVALNWTVPPELAKPKEGVTVTTIGSRVVMSMASPVVTPASVTVAVTSSLPALAGAV